MGVAPRYLPLMPYFFRPARLALPLLALLAALPAAAQVYGGVAFSVGTPQNDFRDALGATGYGVSANVLYHVGRLPLAVGVEGSVMTYGHTRRLVPFSYDVPEVGLHVTTDNNVAQAMAVVRLQPATGRVRPYAEALGGVNYLFTQSAIRGTNEDEPFASTTNYDDVALAGGVGAGALVQLYQSGDPKRRGIRGWFIDARVRYLFGGEASYLGRGDLQTDDGEVTVAPRSSRTDLLIPQVGVTMRF